jgi:uridine kinase
MENRYEKDREYLLKKYDWYGYLANKQFVENTLAINDLLIKRENEKLLNPNAKLLNSKQD